MNIAEIKQIQQNTIRLFLRMNYNNKLIIISENMIRKYFTYKEITYFYSTYLNEDDNTIDWGNLLEIIYFDNDNLLDDFDIYNEKQKIYFFSLDDFNKLFNPDFIRILFTKLQTLKRIDIYDDDINIEEKEKEREKIVLYFFFDAFKEWNKCNNIKFDAIDIDRIFD